MTAQHSRCVEIRVFQRYLYRGGTCAVRDAAREQLRDDDGVGVLPVYPVAESIGGTFALTGAVRFESGCGGS